MGKWEAAYAGNYSHTHKYILSPTYSHEHFLNFFSRTHILQCKSPQPLHTHFFLLPGEYTRTQPLSPSDQPTLSHTLTHQLSQSPFTHNTALLRRKKTEERTKSIDLFPAKNVRMPGPASGATYIASI